MTTRKVNIINKKKSASPVCVKLEKELLELNNKIKRIKISLLQWEDTYEWAKSCSRVFFDIVGADADFELENKKDIQRFNKRIIAKAEARLAGFQNEKEKIERILGCVELQKKLVIKHRIQKGKKVSM